MDYSPWSKGEICQIMAPTKFGIETSFERYLLAFKIGSITLKLWLLNYMYH